MEICKALTLRLKVLNKRSITHIMYTEMEMLSASFFFLNIEKLTHSRTRDQGQGFKHNYAKYAHAHTYIVLTDRVYVIASGYAQGKKCIKI